jgi:hypothetical protein
VQATACVARGLGPIQHRSFLAGGASVTRNGATVVSSNGAQLDFRVAKTRQEFRPNGRIAESLDDFRKVSNLELESGN